MENYALFGWRWEQKSVEQDVNLEWWKSSSNRVHYKTVKQINLFDLEQFCEHLALTSFNQQQAENFMKNDLQVFMCRSMPNSNRNFISRTSCRIPYQKLPHRLNTKALFFHSNPVRSISPWEPSSMTPFYRTFSMNLSFPISAAQYSQSMFSANSHWCRFNKAIFSPLFFDLDV